MRTRTRYFIVTSALVLAVGVGTGLVAYYKGLPDGLFAQGETEELQLLPQHPGLVARVDVRNVMASDLRQRVKQLFPMEAKGREEFSKHTGIDVERDVDAMTVAVMASGPSGPSGSSGASALPTPPVDVLLLVNGRFDANRIEALMREHGATVEEYKGTRLMSPGTPNQPPNQSMSLAFARPSLLAVGSRAQVQAAIDRLNGGASLLDDSEMMTRVRAVEDRDAWAVGRLDALVQRASLPQELAARIPAIDWFAASADIDGGIRANLDVEAHDAEAAQNLRDVIRGVVALARLQANAQPAFKPLLDSLTLGGADRTISLGFSAPVQVLDALAATFTRPGGLAPVPQPPQ